MLLIQKGKREEEYDIMWSVLSLKHNKITCIE